MWNSKVFESGKSFPTAGAKGRARAVTRDDTGGGGFVGLYFYAPKTSLQRFKQQGQIFVLISEII